MALGLEVLSRELPLFLFILSLGHFITGLKTSGLEVHAPGPVTLLLPNCGLASPQHLTRTVTKDTSSIPLAETRLNTGDLQMLAPL